MRPEQPTEIMLQAQSGKRPRWQYLARILRGTGVLSADGFGIVRRPAAHPRNGYGRDPSRGHTNGLSRVDILADCVDWTCRHVEVSIY